MDGNAVTRCAGAWRRNIWRAPGRGANFAASCRLKPDPLKTEMYMKKFLLISLLAAALGGAAPVAFAQAGAAATARIDASAPDALIKTLTTDVMHSVGSDPAMQHGDINSITALVNRKILPYTDFEKTTRLAMGRNWRSATPAQKTQVVEQFKSLLIRTYSGAIAQIRNQEVDYRPFRANPSDTDVVVRTQVINQGQPIQLDYRLEKDGAQWKIYDINVLGVWLVQQYQQQFAEQISRNGIDGLIEFLTQRNQDLAAGKQTQ
jgi:phospholipid transport system substrate-binding protein